MNSLQPLDRQPWTARLAGAASMRTELEHVLMDVATASGPSQIREAIIDRNAARKATHTARNWAWKRLKLRYALDSADAAEFKAFLYAMLDPDPAGRGLTAYLMLARTDRLFRETSLAILVPKLGEPGTSIDADVVYEYIDHARQAQDLAWSTKSLLSVSGHVLTSWKDFGLVEGSNVRRVARLRPSHATIRFVIELARAQGLTDRQALECVWARLLGMDFQAVDVALRSAARDGALEYRTQADVVEIAFPAGR